MPIRDPEPTHQPVLNHVSPMIQDIVFWETRSLNEFTNKEPPAYESPHPRKDRWPNHKLCSVKDAGEGLVRLAYAATRASQQLYNFEVVENPGGNRWPQLRQVWVIRRADYTKGMTVAAPPVGLGGTWTRIDDVERTLEDEALDPVFVRLDVTWEDHATALQQVEHDSETGALLPVTIEKVAHGSAGLATSAGGLFATVDPLNVYWSLKTTRKATGLVDAAQTWESSEAFAWPPVLSQWQYWQEGDRAGFNAYYKEYFGEVKCVNTLAWSQNPPVDLTVTAMQPTGITWQTPVGSWSIRSCLHGLVTGTYTGPSLTLTLTLPATNFTDWPATVTRRPVVRPHPRGGWLLHTKVFHKPGT